MSRKSRTDSITQEFIYRDTRNVEHKVYDYSSNNWSHRNSNKRFKEKFGSHTRKIFNRFTTKDSYTSNMTHNTESIAVWNVKPEWWGSPLIQEKYYGEKACDKRMWQHNNNNKNNNLTAQNIFNMQTNITCSTNCKYPA